MPDFPFLALTVVGQFLTPYELLTLARVNKNWFAALTSDEAWCCWDVFGLKTGVYKHYLASKPDFDQAEWVENTSETEDLEYEEFSNWYALLHRARANILSETDLEQLQWAPRSFLRALAQGPFRLSFRHLPAFGPNDELAYSLLEAGLKREGMNPCYFENERAAQAIAARRNVCS